MIYNVFPYYLRLLIWRDGGALAVPDDEYQDQIVNVIYHWTIRGMGQGKGSKAVLSIYEARRDAGWCCLVCFKVVAWMHVQERFLSLHSLFPVSYERFALFKVAFWMHVQKRVLPLHPHLLISVTAFRSTLAALLAMLQPAPSPLAHSRSSPAADARPLYATVLAVAGNAAGMYSGTVLCIGIA